MTVSHPSMSVSRSVTVAGLGAAFHKYGDAPRAARRPPRKARGARIPGVFDRRATQRGGMHRRPNATVFMKVSTGQPSASAYAHRHEVLQPWRPTRRQADYLDAVV